MVVYIPGFLKKDDRALTFYKIRFDLLNFIEICKLMLSEFRNVVNVMKDNRNPPAQ